MTLGVTEEKIPVTLSPDRVRSNPVAFANKLLKVRDKKKRLVRLAFNPAQRDYLKNRTRRDLILKARQIGFSTMIQAELYRLAITRPVTTMTITDEDKNTAKMRTIANTFHENMPEDWQPKRGKDGATITTYPESASEAMSATAGNKKTGRAGTYTQFHGSEVAFWPDAKLLIAGALQGGNPSAVLESTANGAQGHFYDLCMKALDGDDTWKLHFYPWWVLPEYAIALDEGETITLVDDEEGLVGRHSLTDEQIKWRRDKQKEVGSLFAQEYPENPREAFLLSGRGYFGALDGIFSAPHDATHQEGHRYYAGLDFGQTDYTVLSIGDGTTKKQVALLRLNNMDYLDMIQPIAAACAYWNVKLIAAEENAMGSPIISVLRREGVQNLMNFNTNQVSKQNALSGLRIAFGESGWKLLKAETDDTEAQAREHRAYQTKQTASGAWTFSAPSGQHDDTVIANMLMINAWVNGSIAVPGIIG